MPKFNFVFPVDCASVEPNLVTTSSIYFHHAFTSQIHNKRELSKQKFEVVANAAIVAPAILGKFES